MNRGQGPDAPEALAQPIPWSWDTSVPSGPEITLDVPGCRFEFAHAQGGMVVVRAERPAGVPAWSLPFSPGLADSASLAFAGGRLYVLLFRARVTGAVLCSVDAATGRRLFEVPLQGVGLLHHSKYSNRAQVRIIGHSPVVFGDEAGGRYVEVRDPEDGHVIFNRLEKP
jgi:hypothetical protein